MLSCVEARNTINVCKDNKMKTGIHKILALMYCINSACHYKHIAST